MFAWIVMHNFKPRLEHSYICFAESPSKKSFFLVILYAYKSCKNELLKLPPAFNSIVLNIL